MAISAGDLVKLRGASQSVTPHLNVTPKVTIGTARINQAVFTYPLGALTVDTVSLNGGLADLAAVPVGSLVYVGTSAGAHDVLTTVVRKTCTATVLYIAGMGKGDPGVAVDDITALADDQYVTILTVKPPWGVVSRIFNSTFYKSFDVAYTDQGESPAPVCNIGPWQRLELTGDDVAVTLTNAAVTDVKPASFAWGAKTIASYAWSMRDEDYALDTGGDFDATDAAAATITFDTAGFYIVYCTITDSDSKTHTAETYLWVVDGTTETDIAGWLVDQDRQTREGRQMTIIMNGSVAESAVFPGAGFLYTESQVYSTETVTAGATVNTFVGWVSEERAVREVTHGRVEFDVLAPSLVLKETPAAPQRIEDVTSPVNWAEVTSILSNPNGVAWYILAHHCPNMLAVFDFDPLIDPSTGSRDATPRDHIWTVSSRSVWGQMREILPHQINTGCRSSGALVLRHDPQLMDDTDRTALDCRMTWTASDIREELIIPRTVRLRTGMVDSYAFGYAGGTNATPYWSRSPGDAQANGVDLQTVNGLVVPNTTAQSALNTLAGHLFAKANNPTPQLMVKAMRNFDTADPALMVWHKVTIASTLDPRGRGYTDKRLIPLSVTRNWRQTPDGLWEKQIDIIFEPETVGIAGTTKAIPVASQTTWDPFGDWSGGFFDTGWVTDGLFEDPFGFGNETALIAGFNTDGYLYRTFDFTTPSASGGPTWEQVALSVDGTPLQFVVNAFSYEDGGGIDGWLFTSQKIYLIEDIFGAVVSVTAQHTYSITYDLDNDGINADASWAEEGFVVAAINDSSGSVRVLKTVDSGTTWAETALTTNDAMFAGQTPLVWVSSRTPGKAYVAGVATTGGTYGNLLDEFSWAANNAAPWNVSNVEVSTGSGETLYVVITGDYRANYDFWHRDACWGDNRDSRTYGSWTGTKTSILGTSYGVRYQWYAGGTGYPTAVATTYNDDHEYVVSVTALNDSVARTLQLIVDDFWTDNDASTITAKVYDGADQEHYGVIYSTANYGISWTETAKTLGDCLGGDIDMTWDDNEDESVYRYGRKPSGSYSVYTSGGATITPAQDPGTWAPVKGRWSIESCVADANRILLCAEDGAGNYGVFLSTDAGASWTQIVSTVAGTGTYLRGAVSDLPGSIYLWGGDGMIGWSSDAGTTIDDRMGNLSGYSPAEFVGICGGPAA